MSIWLLLRPLWECGGAADRGCEEGISIVVFVWQVSGLPTGEQVSALLREFQQGFQHFENNILWIVQGCGNGTLDKGCLRQEWIDAVGLLFDRFIYISMSVLRRELPRNCWGLRLTHDWRTWHLRPWAVGPLPPRHHCWLDKHRVSWQLASFVWT